MSEYPKLSAFWLIYAGLILAIAVFNLPSILPVGLTIALFLTTPLRHRWL